MQKIKVEIIRPETYSFGNRVETGVTEIEYVNTDGDQYDWPGIFIRGDDALMRYAPAIEAMLEKANFDESNFMDTVSKNACEGLVDLLKKCRVK